MILPVSDASKAKIMVVDDDQFNLQFVRKLLDGVDVQLRMVTGGEQCLKRLDDTFDLVILDRMMPGMDGIETLKEIRKLYAEMPVLAVTASAEEDGKKFYTDLGFTDYLQKPIEGDKLKDALKEYLPPQKSPFKEGDSEAAMASPDEDDQELLQELSKIDGISVEDGLKFCGNSKSLKKFLNNFATAVDGKALEIEDAYDRGDNLFFTTKVHALKSTARIIGATELAQLAEAVEKAGKEEDFNFINENKDKLLTLYRSYKEKLRVICAIINE
ncbi:response regulator [Butyrivibrio sp. WCD3002]|uniref:response regulator n=1 Tax=Butyrivibrio sp. WCD3002 TaxID=1280676 RepID=UPI0004181EF5|nr:response regulator [Butyrivibrio sp. WCD3002]